MTSELSLSVIFCCCLAGFALIIALTASLMGLIERWAESGRPISHLWRRLTLGTVFSGVLPIGAMLVIMVLFGSPCGRLLVLTLTMFGICGVVAAREWRFSVPWSDGKFVRTDLIDRQAESCQSKGAQPSNEGGSDGSD